MCRFNLIQSNSLSLVLGCILTIGLMSSGCSKNAETKLDEYYVKYEVNSSTIYMGNKLNIELNAENNQHTTLLINTGSTWEAVIGPVQKGFKATLIASEVGSNSGHLRLYTQISVSKNGSPFALKEINGSEMPRTSVEINYTIDY